jgi:hypothetical protein
LLFFSLSFLCSFSNTTRFALACNVSSKLIEPIQSRCAILRFTRLDDKEVLKRLKEVIEAERIEHYTNEGLEAILFTAQGDLRNALNNLQATHAGLGAITPENVFKVVDVRVLHPTSKLATRANSSRTVWLRFAHFFLFHFAVSLLTGSWNSCSATAPSGEYKHTFCEEASSIRRMNGMRRSSSAVL